MSHDLQIPGFGGSPIDVIVHVDRFPEAGKGKVVRREKDYGVDVATALVAVAKLGGRAGFIGWLMSDQRTSEASTAELERHDVRATLPERVADPVDHHRRAERGQVHRLRR